MRAIRHALEHPPETPLRCPSFSSPGMRLTIAFDDVSLPLPPMQRPDVRELVIEQVLDMAAAAGVDDVVLVAALALHRRMTEAELRHALGDRIYDAFAPPGLLTQHDAEDPDNLIHLGTTDLGEDVELNKRAATSDLFVYVNINLVAMDGGHKSVATGLASYRSLRHHHNARTMQASRSFMDQHRSELHSSNWRMGRLIAESGVKIFQIETTLNTNTFPDQFRFLQRREWEWTLRDRAAFAASSAALERTPAAARPPGLALGARTSANDLGAGGRGGGRPQADHRKRLRAAARRRRRPDRHPHDGSALHLPVQRELDHEPGARRMPRARVLLQPLPRGSPLVREGGVLILSHPTPWAFHPGHHPSYIDFFEEVLSESTDPVEIEQYEEAYATDPWYVHLYRTGNAYHGVHPFYMWYWCAHALQHLGGVIVVGGDRAAVRRLGFKPASTLADALEMAEDVVGREPTITHLHAPPIMLAEVR